MNVDGNETTDNALRLQYAIAGAREVLQRAGSAQWKLSAGEWSGFDTWMKALASGLTSEDAEVIRRAAAQLEGLEPRRITRLGESVVPMPEPTRERLNEVVHDIDRIRTGAAGQADDPDPASGPGSGRT
jgi:hypothetical protein